MGAKKLKRVVFSDRCIREGLEVLRASDVKQSVYDEAAQAVGDDFIYDTGTEGAKALMGVCVSLMQAAGCYIDLRKCGSQQVQA